MAGIVLCSGSGCSGGSHSGAQCGVARTAHACALPGEARLAYIFPWPVSDLLNGFVWYCHNHTLLISGWITGVQVRVGVTVMRAVLGAGSPLATKYYAAMEVTPPGRPAPRPLP